MAIKLYTKNYAGMVRDIFKKKAHFLKAFGGALQVKDGVSDSENFLHLKVSDADVVIQEYSTDANVGFGTGTGNSSRFGERKEIKSIDKDVPYDGPLSIHEGIDNFTVNDVPAQVIAERLAKHAVAWTFHVDKFLGALLATSAEAITGANAKALFNLAHKTFVNNKVSTDIGWTAYVSADIYNEIVDETQTTSAKGSTVNLDENRVYKYKGFVIEEVPADQMPADTTVVFSADGVGVAGVGISVTRTIDSEDFNGVALQGAAKYGKYLPDANKKAVLKSNYAPTAGE